MITRRDDIARVYTDPRFSRPALAQRGFTPERLPAIERHAARLLDAMEAGLNPVDLIETYLAPLSVHVSPDLHGVFAVGVVTLLAHRKQLLQCVDDETLWPRAAEEVLRCHHNGLLGLPLVTTEPHVLHNVSLDPGDTLCAPMLGNLWDPARFDAPEKFTIHRALSPGATPQNLFLSTAYAALFRRFEELDLAVSVGDIPWQHDTFIPEPTGRWL